ncbi:hypothetical protein TRVL_07479 [Trypanosoma vivax]|nr:hypothetical protein TRVL_07479 [Trypanosoma vivax]
MCPTVSLPRRCGSFAALFCVAFNFLIRYLCVPRSSSHRAVSFTHCVIALCPVHVFSAAPTSFSASLAMLPSSISVFLPSILEALSNFGLLESVLTVAVMNAPSCAVL